MESDYEDSDHLLNNAELQLLELEERLTTCESLEAIRDIVAEYA